MQTRRNLCDAHANNSHLIGTHSRLRLTDKLTDFMAGDDRDVTSPGLDIDDFIGISFTTGPDGTICQLPDQQFANLYWVPKARFDRPDLDKRFKEKCGYELGVPVNWSACEDFLHQRRQGDRRRPRPWPHERWQARPIPPGA